jgi:hypothetical protein
MKNVVVEIQGNYAVIMNDTGEFKRIKNKAYEIGQRIELNTSKVRIPASLMKWLASTAAAAILLLGGTAYAYNTPYTELSLDINPSIELSANIFNTIIDVTAMNEDAQRILDRLQLRDCDLQTAIQAITAELKAEGYLTDDEIAQIMVTACSQDQERAQTMLRDMIQALQQETARDQVRANIDGECIGAELKTRAREYGVSPGKLMLVERYAQSTGDPSSVNVEDWLGRSVKDILNAISENAQNGQKNPDTGNGYNGGDTSSNGYSGGNTSGNGQNSGDSNQNGYSGGDTNNNGYNGGEDNGKNTSAPSNGNGTQNGSGNGNTQTSPGSGAANQGSCTSEPTGNAADAGRNGM